MTHQPAYVTKPHINIISNALVGAHQSSDKKMELELTAQNRCVLDIVAASIGLISTDIRIIWFRIVDDTLMISFAVNSKSPQVIEDIEDIIFEVEALNVGEITTDFELLEYVAGMDCPEDARMIYRAKDE